MENRRFLFWLMNFLLVLLFLTILSPILLIQHLDLGTKLLILASMIVIPLFNKWMLLSIDLQNGRCPKCYGKVWINGYGKGMCENHIDGENYLLVGKKCCNFTVSDVLLNIILKVK